MPKRSAHSTKILGYEEQTLVNSRGAVSYVLIPLPVPRSPSQ